MFVRFLADLLPLLLLSLLLVCSADLTHDMLECLD